MSDIGLPIQAEQLTAAVAPLGEALRETVHSLVGCEIKVDAPQLRQVSPTDFGAARVGACHVAIRSHLEHGGNRHPLRFWFPVETANSLSGRLLMIPEDRMAAAIQSGMLIGEEHEAFHEIANILTGSVRDTLRQSVAPELEIHLDSVETVANGDDAAAELGDEDAILFAYQMTVVDEAPVPVWMTIGHTLAADWNGEEIECEGAGAAVGANGRLAAFLFSRELVETVRSGAHRAGLEFARYPRTSIPNPAAHRTDIVLLDIPVGNERRFDWCQRIKSFDANIPVALVLHSASRESVFQGFRAGADVIVAWPLDATELAKKLGNLEPANSTED